MRTVIYYIERGYLERVYGSGPRAIGVTKESLARFMTRHVVLAERRLKREARPKAAESSARPPEAPQAAPAPFGK